MLLSLANTSITCHIRTDSQQQQHKMLVVHTLHTHSHSHRWKLVTFMAHKHRKRLRNP